MGGNMARRLKDKGAKLAAVYDVVPEVAQALAEELGCAAPGSLADVTALADVIFTAVSDDKAMETIFAESGDSLLTGASGRLFINCATVSPQINIIVEGRAEKFGALCLEACMASSITKACEGTLYMMCAGKAPAYKRARPILEKIASSIWFTEGAGQAAKVKALVNMVMNINTAALAEGLGLADALGFDLQLIRDVFAHTGANSRVLQTDGEDMQNRDHSCFFSAAHAAKDSGIALRLARAEGLDLPLAEATKAQFYRMIFEGLGELDKSGIAELTFKGRLTVG